MAFLMSRLQASAISCSSLSPCVNSRGFPTATARVKGLASSTLLSWFSMDWRSSTIIPQQIQTTKPRHLIPI